VKAPAGCIAGVGGSGHNGNTEGSGPLGAVGEDTAAVAGRLTELVNAPVELTHTRRDDADEDG